MLPVESKVRTPEGASKVLSLYELTHTKEKVPFWLEFISVHREILISMDREYESLESEEDFIEYIKNTLGHKQTYILAVDNIKFAQTEQYKSNEEKYGYLKEFWESMKAWLEEKEKEGVWEL